jgi:hypothetical protein
MRTLLVLAAMLLAVAAAGAIPLAMTSEAYQWQDRQDGDPLCLNEDDILRWTARGDLAQGQSFAFTPQHASCQERTTWGTFVFKGVRHNDHPQVRVTVTSDSPTCTGCGIYLDNGVQYQSVYDCYFGKPCWKGTWCAVYAAYPSGDPGPGTFMVTVENLGPGSAIGVYLLGEDDSSWLHSCA